VASPETQFGLPESRVGVLPGGGGTGIMRLRMQTSAKDLADAAVRMSRGSLSSNADEARTHGYLRQRDVTIYHPDRLIVAAIEEARKVEVVPRPVWEEISGPVVGMADRELEQLKSRGELSDHDLQIGDRIKSIIGKAESFEEALDMERKAFIALCQEGLTLARIKHMLETGKPLRN
jgi:3-hydroxyacyl-CoA dehydrogenase